MLEVQRTYTKKELSEYYQTARRDLIKKKLDKCGYSYIEAGRGESFTVTITELPPAEEQLKEYCVERLGFAAQTDFSLLLPFIYACIADDEFIKLQHNEIQEEMKKRGVKISLQTISKYLEKLESNGWIYALDNTEFVYYVYNPVEKKNVYISKQEYKQIYSCYWNMKRCGLFAEAQYILTAQYGNAPKKRAVKQRNGIFANEYSRFIELFEERKKENGY